MMFYKKSSSFVFNVKTAILSAIFFLGFATSVIAQDANAPRKGVWVTCFSEKEVLYSIDAARELVQFCKRAKIDEIYLQLYRADQAYYDSKISSRQKYEIILQRAKLDTIELLLKEAHANGVKVFAWVNALSIATNKNAEILRRFGESVLTRDQYLRPSQRDEQKNESDDYYLRDTQFFLEPGDKRVRGYLVSLVEEIITRYPTLDGIHLDYIRYPYPVPFIPNSQFNTHGLTYGYGEENLRRFEAVSGLNPLTMSGESENYLTWDNWKREQITSLVKEISDVLKAASPEARFSCAVIHSPERAYSAAFQDWPLWLEEGIVNYVVIMNYTRDRRLAKEITRSALAHKGMGEVYVGIGSYLLKNEPERFLTQFQDAKDLGVDGVVFFSYDDISVNEEAILASELW